MYARYNDASMLRKYIAASCYRARYEPSLITSMYHCNREDFSGYSIILKDKDTENNVI